MIRHHYITLVSLECFVVAYNLQLVLDLHVEDMKLLNLSYFTVVVV